jgi:hypothetical protein
MSEKRISGARPIKRKSAAKRKRRTKSDIENLCQQILEIGEEIQPFSVRQMFYQMSVRGLIGKTEKQYKNVTGRLLGIMRKEGRLPFDWVVDNTRWMRKPGSWSSLESMLYEQKKLFRRSLWEEQPVYVEIWLEKESLSGVLYQVTEQWDVPLMPTRGFASLSFIHSAAESFQHISKPIFVYYFGDHDPSGLAISKDIETKLRQYAPNAEIYFEKIAVTPEQIERYGLPTRPTKMKDSRAKTFKGDSVELDAIHPVQLRQLCESCITQHIDIERYSRMKEVERLERDTLRSIIDSLTGAT